MEDNDIHFASITETWFDSETGRFTAIIKDAGYEIIHAYRTEKGGGGAAIIYRESFKVKRGEASSTNYSSFEYTYLTFLSQKMKVLLVCIYRKQEINCSIFCKEFEEFMEKVFNQGESIILTGDFNIWAENKSNSKTKEFTQLMNSYGLMQQIKVPTHQDGHTLDHLYINELQLIVKHEVLHDRQCIKTDHFPYIVQIPEAVREDSIKQEINYRNIKNIDIDTLKDDFKKVSDEIVNTCIHMNFEEKYKRFDELSRAVIEKHAPVKKKIINLDKAPPWMDTEYKQNRAQRRRLEKKWKKSKLANDREAYISQRKTCSTMSLYKQKIYYSKVITEAGNNQKELFKVVNEVLDRKKIKSLPEHSDSKQLADEFNQFYIDKIVKLRKTISTDIKQVLDIHIELFEGEKLTHFELATEEEVTTILKEFSIKTSLDDPIPAAILKNLVTEAVPTLTELINTSLSTGSVDGIKLSILNPLLKKCGLDTEKKKNYRPVNNLLFMSKLIERVVLNRLDQHMIKNNLHCHSQFAYKTNHNTETMMLSIVDDALNGFDNDKCTVIVFLDLSAAFDTIDHETLLNILSEEIGIKGIALQWFRSFLTGRTQRVNINNHLSDILLVLFGAPQGTVLGPRLFSIYVRNQPKVFNIFKFKATSFADDSNGAKKFSLCFQYNVLKNDVANCMNSITNYMNSQFLKINPDKTEILLLYPKHLDEHTIIRGTIIGNQCIRFSNVVKNVGLWLDKNLNFECHINKIVSHCHKLLKDIRRVRSLLSKKNTEMLVHAVISSRIDYCNSIFLNINKANLYKLQKVQNTAARLVVQKSKTESISSTLKDLHWLRVESRIIFKVLLIVHKIILGKCPSSLCSLLDYKQFNYRPMDFLKLKTETCNNKYGKRAFRWAAPRLWNALSLEIRTQDDTEKFKTSIKTLLFQDTDGFLHKAYKFENHSQ